MAVYRKLHEVTLPMGRFPAIRAAASRAGRDAFLDSLNPCVVNILRQAGTRTFDVGVDWLEPDAPDGGTVALAVWERHTLQNLVARLFWAPLNILRGHKPWQLDLETALPLNLVLLKALADVGGQFQRQRQEELTRHHG